MYNWDVVGDNAMEPSKTGTDVYRSRNPRTSDYFCSVEANFEELEGIWDDRAMQAGTAIGVPIRWM